MQQSLNRGHGSRIQDVLSIYGAALDAVREVARDPAGEVLRVAIDKFAAGAGLPVGDAFFETALTLKAAHQGEILWQINKMMDKPALRTRLADRLAETVYSPEALSSAPPPSYAADAEVFARDGFLGLAGLVSEGEARGMLAYLKTCTALTRQETVLHHEPRDVARAPYAFRIATDERLLAVAHGHLGVAPTILQMDAWWSLPESETPMGAQIFHRDRDDFRACKLFVYLSDVTADDGPHIFVRGSHREDMVQDILAKNGRSGAAAVFFARNGRHLAGAIESVFGGAVREITGPPGTSFLENTYGFHRGKVPKTGSRCVFQVLYGVVPYAHSLERWSGVDLAFLPSDCGDSPLARHAARFAAP